MTRLYKVIGWVLEVTPNPASQYNPVTALEHALTHLERYGSGENLEFDRARHILIFALSRFNH